VALAVFGFVVLFAWRRAKDPAEGAASSVVATGDEL